LLPVWRNRGCAITFPWLNVKYKIYSDYFFWHSGLVNYDIIARKNNFLNSTCHYHALFNKEEIMSLQKLLDELEVLKVEYEKFERGNKSAGTRARKSLQNVKKISQEIRNQIQEAKKTEETEETKV
jgi:hypothetical protein